MKTVIFISAGLMLTATAFPLSAQVSTSYPIRVEIAADPIDLAGLTSEASFPGVSFNSTNRSNRTGGQPCSEVWNDGYATIDYTVQATMLSGSWSLGPAPGNNIACLSAVFAEPLSAADDAGTNSFLCRDLLAADFGTEDTLSSTPARSSATALARDAGNETYKGHDVQAADSRRTLRYQLATPVSGDASPQQIVITIGAVDSSM